LTPEMKIDLWPFIESLFFSLNGRHVSCQETKEGYIISSDPTSGSTFEYEPGGLVALTTEKSLSNVAAHLDETLLKLNGRLVRIEINDDLFKIAADPDENVFRLNSPVGGEVIKIPTGVEKAICKIGQGPETCIFFDRDPSEGFLCGKFSFSGARFKLERLAKHRIIAERIGNCGLARE